MKKPGHFLRQLLPWCLMAGIAFALLLMVCNLYKPAHPDHYTARGGSMLIPELTGLPPDSLLNSGDVKALDALPGIGEVLAGRIIETRERDGLFFFPEDVMTVSGIGEKRYHDIMTWLAAQEASPTDLPAAPQ